MLWFSLKSSATIIFKTRAAPPSWFTITIWLVGQNGFIVIYVSCISLVSLHAEDCTGIMNSPLLDILLPSPAYYCLD